VAPAASVTSLTGTEVTRLADRPICACEEDTSETPGYPYSVHLALEVLVKPIVTSTPPA
jgi:hypothetical protein